MDEAKNKAPPHRTTFQMMLFSAIYKRFILYRYCPAVGKSQIIFLAFAQLWARLKFIFWRLPNFGQVSNYFFGVCPTLGKSQIIFFAFAQPWASLKLFFWRLPNSGQVSNLFFDVCRNLGIAQIYFLAFAGTSASLKFIFWRLPNHGQVPNYFFGVCRNLGKSQIYFLAFAGTSASSFTSKREGACLSASPLLYCFEINGSLRAFPYLLFQPWLVKHTNKLQHDGFVCDRLRLNCLQQDFRYPCLLHS